MNKNKQEMHGIWANRWVFILAATGSAVGLGNIWKFPYITGENGGGAFVLVYLVCILVAGIPVMMAETLIGRLGRMSPIHSIQQMSREYGAPFLFKSIGWVGALAGFFILSFYSVISGWTLAYIGKLASGEFTNAYTEVAQASFSGLLADPVTLMALHTLFMLMVGWVIARGVKKGLEDTLRIMMPLLFLMLIGLLIYATTTSGFTRSLHFLFDFDFGKLSFDSIIVALGHAFFTLSLGMGAIMAYGAYMPAKAPLGKTVLTVGVLDTLVALVSGVIVFSIVFSNGMEAGSGPGLMFQTLPIAFGSMPGGQIIGTVFFILVAIAAWSSALSIAEPAVAWAVEKGVGRLQASLMMCGFAWFLGIGTVLSFNEWAEVKLLGKTIFESLDFITANVMLPLGGVLIAVFVGWFMKERHVAKEANINNIWLYNTWRIMLRFISPLAVFYIFIHGLIS